MKNLFSIITLVWGIIAISLFSLLVVSFIQSL